MQKKYLIINTKYKEVELGLFYDNTIIDKFNIENKSINKLLINTIDQTLKSNDLKLQSLDFIAANQGPAPFTTLRSVLATLNGFNFGAQVPLIGVNGIYALLANYIKTNVLNDITVIALLNAFGQDLYYAYKKNCSSNDDIYNYMIGCSNYLKLFNALKLELNLEFKDKVIFIGNGAELYKNDIMAVFNNRAVIDYGEFTDSASLEAIKDQAIYSYYNKNITDTLMPIYLKTNINNIKIV